MESNINAKVERAQAVYDGTPFDQVFDAAEIVAGCRTKGGESIIERFRKSGDFSALAGVAYLMGVNEGRVKSREEA